MDAVFDGVTLLLGMMATAGSIAIIVVLALVLWWRHLRSLGLSIPSHETSQDRALLEDDDKIKRIDFLLRELH